MNKDFYALRYLIISLMLISSLILVYAVGREFYTWSYLKGFADAIVPASASPEEKAEALVVRLWMRSRSTRHSYESQELKKLVERDPIYILNHERLLQICGTAVNAYVNVAYTAGLQVRRLILLDNEYQAKHVVAEVRLDGRWVIVDPAFGRLMRDAQSHLLTKIDLRDHKALQEATHGIANYLPDYTYERTTLIRLERLPFLGRLLRRALNSFFPEWEEAATPIVRFLDRRSSIQILEASVLICLSLLVHLGISRHTKRRDSQAGCEHVSGTS
jgi:hypothetical protein